MLRGVRLLGVAYYYHSTAILTFFLFTLPVYDEICKRSMKFIASSLVSSSHLVKSIASYRIMFGRNNSVLGTNALLCCDQYNWSLSELVSNPEQIKYFSFNFWYFNNLSDTQKITSSSLLELLTIRDGQLFLPRLRMFFTCQQINDIIEISLHILIVYALFFWSYVHFCRIAIRKFVCFLYWIYVLKVRINIIIIIIIKTFKGTAFQELTGSYQFDLLLGLQKRR